MTRPAAQGGRLSRRRGLAPTRRRTHRVVARRRTGL